MLPATMQCNVKRQALQHHRCSVALYTTREIPKSDFLPALPKTTIMSGLKSPAPTVAQLRASLKSLQTALDPVMAQSLEELTSSIEESNKDGKLQSAQMYVSMAYVILDLVWILLKVSAIDPVTHPVTNDLKRVSEYLHKVHGVSTGEEQKEEVKENRAPIDKGKVGRFIRHALGTTAQGKKTLFGDDGSVQKIVEAGEAQEEAGEGAEEQKEKSPIAEASLTSNKGKGQLLKAEKALKKASDAMASSSKKKHKK
jgi:exosome complex protein LRP1